MQGEVQTNRNRLLVGSGDVRKLRHPGLWMFTAVLVFLVAITIHELFTNERFGWDVIGRYFFSSALLKGLAVTLQLTVLAMVIGISLGAVLALMRMSKFALIRSTAGVYIWVFRSVPLLVQVIIWFNISALFPDIGLGLPFGGPLFVEFDANQLITPYVAACLGLGLNEAAYMAEIIRAGIGSVDEGQQEAATALGLNRRQMMLRVILPQAMRVIIPPTGNNTIGMLKNTSIVSFVAVADLLYSAQLIYSRTFETIPLLFAVSLWYLLLTSLLGIGQHYIERHYKRGSSRNAVVSRRAKRAKTSDPEVDAPDDLTSLKEGQA